MHTTLFNHPRLSVQVETGSEGPRHDPYAYREITIVTPLGTLILHEGLGDWFKMNGKRIAPDDLEQPSTYYRSLIQYCTGYTLEQIERIGRKLKSRCRHCGGRDFEHSPGFPGEYFEICVDCNNIHDTHFNISEIE